MKVEKLIQLLQKLPADAEINFEVSDSEVEELLNPSEDLDIAIKDNWQLLPLRNEEE